MNIKKYYLMLINYKTLLTKIQNRKAFDIGEIPPEERKLGEKSSSVITIAYILLIHSTLAEGYTIHLHTQSKYFIHHELLMKLAYNQYLRRYIT